MTRITKNELIAINARLAADNATLRAELDALKTTVAALKGQTTTRRESASKGTASGTKRALASFWSLIDAGGFITDLKKRGCKVALTARRDERGHFVVFAG